MKNVGAELDDDVFSLQSISSGRSLTSLGGFAADDLFHDSMTEDEESEDAKVNDYVGDDDNYYYDGDDDDDGDDDGSDNDTDRYNDKYNNFLNA